MQSVLNLEEEATKAYLLAFFGGIIFFVGQICRHNNFNESAFIVGKVRSSLVYLMFTKLSGLSQYTVNSQEVGKITNILSNDFNVI